jgi:hypothetical protein
MGMALERNTTVDSRVMIDPVPEERQVDFAIKRAKSFGSPEEP